MSKTAEERLGQLVSVAEPVNFNPGITGFIKASRHHTGPTLVMTNFRFSEVDWLGVFWVKRLAHNASRYSPQYFRLMSEKTRTAVERHFDYMLISGPPPTAKTDSQRIRVYDWEDDNIFPTQDRPMPWCGCLLFADYVWQRVGAGKALVLTREGRSKRALSYGGSIHIPADNPAYRTKPLILHEIAHELNEFDQHGPGFVATYMDLCVRFLGLDRQYLRDSASRYGVRFLW